MSETVKPATDAEVSAWKVIAERRDDCFEGTASLAVRRLVARIEEELGRATINGECECCEGETRRLYAAIQDPKRDMGRVTWICKECW